jgi:hypothetical protein
MNRQPKGANQEIFEKELELSANFWWSFNGHVKT